MVVGGLLRLLVRIHEKPAGCWRRLGGAAAWDLRAHADVLGRGRAGGPRQGEARMMGGLLRLQPSRKKTWDFHASVFLTFMVVVAPHPRTQCCASPPQVPPGAMDKIFKVNIEAGVRGYGKSAQAATTNICNKLVGVARDRIQVFFFTRVVQPKRVLPQPNTKP